MHREDPHPLARAASNERAVGGPQVHDADRAVGGSKAHHRVKPADAGVLQVHVCCLVPVATGQTVRQHVACKHGTKKFEVNVPAENRARLSQRQRLDDSLVLDALQDSARYRSPSPGWRTPLIRRRGRGLLLSLFSGRLRCPLRHGNATVNNHWEACLVGL